MISVSKITVTLVDKLIALFNWGNLPTLITFNALQLIKAFEYNVVTFGIYTSTSLEFEPNVYVLLDVSLGALIETILFE